MRKKFQEQLFKKYPEIFVDITKPPEESGMAFGIQTGDGWYWLIDQICAELQWLTKQGHPQVIAFQIKEKFGSLRFYTRGESNQQNDLLSFAERLSKTICENCGSTHDVKMQKRKDGPVIATLCNKCRG